MPEPSELPQMGEVPPPKSKTETTNKKQKQAPVPRANPLMRIRKVSAFEDQHRAKLLVTGSSGAGKSHMGALLNVGGPVLIGLCELQAVPSILRSNPEAEIFPMETMEDVVDFLTIISSPKLGTKYGGVVCDSLTDVQRIIKAHYMKQQNKRQDVADTDTWQVVIDKTAQVARTMRNAVVHTMTICLDAEENVNGVGIVHRPGVSGKKLPNDLSQYVQASAFLAKRDTAKGIRRELVFEAGERYLTKGYTGLRSIEPPEPAWLVHKMFGTELPDDVATRVAEWEAMTAEAEEE